MLWFMDGFDHYQTVDMLMKWNTIGTATVGPSYSRGGGQGASLNNTSMTKQRVGTPVDTFVIGVSIRMGATAGGTLITVGDSASEQVSVRTDGTGRLNVQRQATVLATSTNVYSVNTWYYLEFKTKIHNTTGTYEVRVNGTSTGWIPAVTGANTRSTANNQATYMGLNSAAGQTTYYDDLYCLDNVGSTNIDFLGPQVINTLYPNGAGNYTQWTPNSNTNFFNASDTYQDGDTTFNQSSTANQKDTFVFKDIPGGTVAGIQHVIMAKQSAGTQRSIRPIQRSGSTDYAGATVNTSTSYTMTLEPKDVDPATAAAFSVANLNAAEFGYELVS